MVNSCVQFSYVSLVLLPGPIIILTLKNQFLFLHSKSKLPIRQKYKAIFVYAIKHIPILGQ